MKPVIVVPTLLTVLALSCAPGGTAPQVATRVVGATLASAATAAASATPEPTQTRPPTPPPVPTQTRTPTATPTPKPTRTPVPSPTPGVTIEFDAGVSDEHRQWIRNAVDAARAAFGDAGNVTLFAYSDCRSLYQAWVQYYGYTWDPPNESGCGQWEHVAAYGDGGAMFLNLSPGFLPPSNAELAFLSVILHEYYHNVQSYWAGMRLTVGDKRGPFIGPVWLFEGSASYFQARALADLGKIEFASWAYPVSAVASQPRLDAYESWDSARAAGGGPYVIGFLATQFIVREHGEESLLRYWQIRSTTRTWQAAFEKAFGESIASFYERFEAYRQAGNSE